MNSKPHFVSNRQISCLNFDLSYALIKSNFYLFNQRDKTMLKKIFILFTLSFVGLSSQLLALSKDNCSTKKHCRCFSSVTGISEAEVSTIKVLQYNMKFGKPGQACCHQAQGNQKGMIAQVLSQNSVDFACLIECQSAADDKTCLDWTSSGYGYQCQTCPGTSSSYDEAITLIYNTNRYDFKAKWTSSSLEGCCAASQKGRGFIAIALTEKSSQKEVIFIGIHSPQNFPNNPYTDALLSQIADAISGLGGSAPQVILAGDFNYVNNKPGHQENSNDLRDHLTAKFGSNWSNISNLIQCRTNNSSYNSAESFDNVFINQSVSSMVCEIPAQYVSQTDLANYSSQGTPYKIGQNGVYSALTKVPLGDGNSEEHLPLLVTISE